MRCYRETAAASHSAMKSCGHGVPTALSQVPGNLALLPLQAIMFLPLRTCLRLYIYRSLVPIEFRKILIYH